MNMLTYDVAAPVTRNRLSVGLRILYAIPHLVVSQVWQYLAQILGVIQWFIVLFTGQRNVGMWNLQNQWLGYYGRTLGYVELLYDDPYPPFGTDAATSPVRQTLTFEGPANRLTNGLRLIWIIPAAIISGVLGLVAAVLVLVSWFAILITGSQPAGLRDFVLKAVRYVMQTQAYGLLMTDTYPKYG